MPQPSITDAQRIEIIKSFILNSPPGEVNDVLNDVRFIVNNDALLQKNIVSILQQYDEDQFLTTTIESDKVVSVTPFNKVDASSTYHDPNHAIAFSFDHPSQKASDVKPYNSGTNSQDESLRTTLQNSVSQYVKRHYPAGQGFVFSGGKGNKCFDIIISANKFNPSNFWNGRWRSHWHYNPTTKEVSGWVKVNVHYYEDGNVQLNQHLEKSFSVSSPEEIGDRIKAVETDLQDALNESYSQLSESTFKVLRRALPVTRNKIDWDKILTYKIGSELGTSN